MCCFCILKGEFLTTPNHFPRPLGVKRRGGKGSHRTYRRAHSALSLSNNTKCRGEKPSAFYSPGGNCSKGWMGPNCFSRGSDSDKPEAWERRTNWGVAKILEGREFKGGRSEM